MKNIRFFTIFIVMTSIVFGIIPQIVTNIASAQVIDLSRCSGGGFGDISVTQCSFGGSGTGANGAGGSGGRTEITVCDSSSGTCFSDSVSGGSGTGPSGAGGGGIHGYSSFGCTFDGCSFGDTVSGGGGVGGSSFDRPQQGFSSGGVALQQGGPSGGNSLR